MISRTKIGHNPFCDAFAVQNFVYWIYAKVLVNRFVGFSYAILLFL
jgi:hypothetical protein